MLLFLFPAVGPAKNGWMDLRKAGRWGTPVILTRRVCERESPDRFGKRNVNARKGYWVCVLYRRQKRGNHHQFIDMTMETGGGNLFERPVIRCLGVPVIGQQVVQDLLGGHAKTEKQ